jgi:hypothetical protein
MLMRETAPDTGLLLILFAALLTALAWPIISIPKGLALAGWLFGAWGAGIALLWLVSRAGRGGGGRA